MDMFYMMLNHGYETSLVTSNKPFACKSISDRPQVQRKLFTASDESSGFNWSKSSPLNHHCLNNPLNLRGWCHTRRWLDLQLFSLPIEGFQYCFD